MRAYGLADIRVTVYTYPVLFNNGSGTSEVPGTWVGLLVQGTSLTGLILDRYEVFVKVKVGDPPCSKLSCEYDPVCTYS